MNIQLNFTAALLCFFAFNGNAFSACKTYDTEGITLKGKVELKTFFGPPNYGENPETDAKEVQALLKLDMPLCTIESVDEQAEKNQNLVTLIPLGNFSLKKFSGQHVSVTGSLIHSISGHHHTPVLIDLKFPPIIEHD